MAAKDYEFVTGLVTPYLAKKTKGHVMSQDRRPIENYEILGLFEFYLRKWCEESKKDTMIITDGKGKKLFEAKLLDKNETSS